MPSHPGDGNRIKKGKKRLIRKEMKKRVLALQKKVMNGNCRSFILIKKRFHRAIEEKRVKVAEARERDAVICID